MKKHLILLSCILMSCVALADDFDDFDDFGDSGETKSYFTTSLKGNFGYENRINFQDGYKKDLPYLHLQPTIESEYVDLIGDFTLDKFDERLFVEELYTRFYLGDKVQVELGREKIIWGKGDKVHVLNNFNATDYRDFINGEYREELIGEDMARVLYTPFDDSEARLEFVYTPEFHPNKYATEGPWQPKVMKDLDAGLGKIAEALHQPTKSSSSYLPNQKQFKDDQGGLRFTNSKNGIDYGFSYYHGFEKDPTVDKHKLGLAAKGDMSGFYAAKDIQNGNLDVHYDQLDVFGFEASKVILGINGRFETAYYLTKDVKGTDPNVKNNRIETLIGGDRSLSDYGLGNLNVNIQLKTRFILNKDEIKNNQMDLVGHKFNYDNDYNEIGYIKNTAIFKLEDKFRSDTIIPSLKFVYNVEDHDFAIMPAIDYIYKDNTTFTLGYNIYDGDESTEIGQFRKNDFGYVKIQYNF